MAGKPRACYCGIKPPVCKGLCEPCYRRRLRSLDPELRKRRSIAAGIYHKAHPERRNEVVRQWRSRERIHIKRVIRELKSLPCVDCGNCFPWYIMELDHARGEKKFNVTTSVVGMGRKVIEAELAKCDVVCANCHKIRTYSRRQCYTNPNGELKLDAG